MGKLRSGSDHSIGYETGVLEPRPKLLEFYMPGVATHPMCPIKRHSEGREDSLHISGHAVARGKVSTQPIFSHLQDTDMSHRFK
jgi:hypothetical protein